MFVHGINVFYILKSIEDYFRIWRVFVAPKSTPSLKTVFFPKTIVIMYMLFGFFGRRIKGEKTNFLFLNPTCSLFRRALNIIFFFFFSYPKPSPITKTRDESTERIYAFYQFRCNNTRGFLQPFPVQSSDFRPLLTRDVPSISVSETVQSVRTFLKRVVESAAFGQ